MSGSNENENNILRQILIGIFIILFAGVVLGATGWNFTKVSQIPEKYMQKKDIEKFIEINRQEHIVIEQKLDRLLELIIECTTSIKSTDIVYLEEEENN